MRGMSVRRLTGLAVAVAAAAGLTAAVPADAAKAKTYQAPFHVAAQGGDQWSYHSADAQGTVTVGRVYVVPGVINCTKGGPFARLSITHKATAPVRKVVVSYDNAAVDNFTFAMVSLRDRAKHWYGTTTARGFLTGAGSITLVPDRPQGPMPRKLTVEFGLQQSSACPSGDVGTIHFTGVQVFS